MSSEATAQPAKKRLATVWLAGCSGCHMSLLDIDERILEVARLADIVKSPIVDTKEFPAVDIALVEGAVASDEHLREILHIREKAEILVAFGDCAVTGNVAACRNTIPTAAVINRSYREAESNDGQGEPPSHPLLQKLLDRVMPLHEVVEVDYFIPGCPPSADLIFHVLSELLHNRIPNLDKARLKYG